MKTRLSALALILCLCLTACGGESASSTGTSSAQPPQQSSASAPTPAPEPVLVADELDFSVYSTPSANAVPDLLYWSNGGASYDDAPAPKDTIQIYKYRSSMAVVEDYVAMLCENGYTLVDQYSIKDLHSWGLVSDTVEAPTMGMMYTDTPCHLSIWTNGEKKFRMDVPYEFEVCDTGSRRDSGDADLSPQGPSAAAGLIRLPDGSYQTTDGRLTASVGKAAVIRDGQSLTCGANLIMRDDDGSDRLWVEDYYRNEGFYFESPRSYLMQGDLFRMSDLSRERAYSTSKDGQDAYNWGGCYFSICHNGEWIPPTWNGKDYDALTVRVMYDEKGGDRVYYVYARFTRSEPTEVEALVAVSSKTTSGLLEDARYLSVGETLELRWDREEFGSDYHVYNWEVVEGADKVSMEGVGNSRKITGLRSGAAVVRMVYEYTEEEPDVLTGILRDARHSHTEEFVLIVE